MLWGREYFLLPGDNHLKNGEEEANESSQDEHALINS